MQIVIAAGVILLGYILGSIPFGLLIVKMKTGKDIRTVESGRTGGTNAMRAAGFGAGLLTAIMDILKGAAAVWAARAIAPESDLLQVLAPIASIVGHNYSMFVIERDANGKFVRLRGGAGGAPAVGGALGLWAPSLLTVLPLGALVFFTLGYASVTTISVAVFATLYFAWQAMQGVTPWVNVIYGLAALVLLLWALRPNIVKLFSGNERVVKYSLHGWFRSRGSQAASN